MNENRDKWLERTELLLGREKLERLHRSRVLVVGLGGVGAYAAEMIARAGVGHMTVADADVVSESNINRQLIALHSTVGCPKTEVMAERLRDINPDIDLRTVARFIKDDETYALLDSDRFDYVVDAIDTLSPKLALIIGAMERGIPLVSSMGAGAKTDPARMEIADISATHHCRSTPDTTMRSAGSSADGMANMPTLMASLPVRICGTAKLPQGYIALLPLAKLVQASL